VVRPTLPSESLEEEPQAKAKAPPEQAAKGVTEAPMRAALLHVFHHAAHHRWPNHCRDIDAGFEC